MVTACKQTTSLWALVEAMQRCLEREGLEAPAVDAEVARGLQSLLCRDMFASARRLRSLSR
jgi:hypothetical protein